MIRVAKERHIQTETLPELSVTDAFAAAQSPADLDSQVAGC